MSALSTVLNRKSSAPAKRNTNRSITPPAKPAVGPAPVISPFVEAGDDLRVADMLLRAGDLLTALDPQGQKALAPRLSGIQALAHLLRLPPTAQEAMNVLCAYVRDNAPLSGYAEPLPLERDVEEALLVLRRRQPIEQVGKRLIADLRRTDLRGTSFNQAHLEFADFAESCLAGVTFQEAALDGSNFCDADLCEADMLDALLRGAQLGRAQLQNSFLTRARLLGANLTGARLQGADLSGAHLENAVLRSANLQGADLRGARFEKTDFTGADLRGADLTSTFGLTSAMLRSAYVDESTRLPEF